MKKLPLLLTLLLTSVALAAGQEDSTTHLPADEYFVIDDVATGLSDAMEIAVAPDGAVFVIERTGAVKRVVPDSGEVKTVATLEVEVRKGEYARESGLLGITLHPNFAQNRWIFLFYSVKAEPVQRLSRFTFGDNHLADEKVVLEFAHDRDQAVCHEGGSLTFGPQGNLWLSTGDNTCPFKSDGYGPIDERDGRHYFDAQRSAANSNDLRGKILRIRPTADGGYEIPEGNLFAPGTPDTRPEIYAMGCRNPFRISVDSKTGFVYWGEVGPDAAAKTERGPSGFDEINQAREPGNFGWPYFLADNKAYADFDFETAKVGKKFDSLKPVNDSPNNTGIAELPAATLPLWHYPRASACAGPVYRRGNFPDSAGHVFPEVFDGALLVYDWTSAWLRVLKLDDKGENVVWNEPWMSRHLFVHPVDMEIGNDGEVWLLEYGSAWYDGSDGRLRKITYSEDPVALDLTQDDPRMDGLDPGHPGAKLIAGTTCLACHMTKQKSIGPTYRDVARKYAEDAKARDMLSAKILNGGSGVWGPVPMPPHPQHNIEETQQMVDAILGFREKGHDQEDDAEKDSE